MDISKETFQLVDQYISDLFPDQNDDALAATEKSLDEADLPHISVSSNQGKFLHILARVSNAKKILEIGTLAGYSTIWLARALPETGKLITLEFDPKHARVAGENIERAGLSAVVEIRVGKALDLLPEIEKENAAPFDMIFIDADKIPYAEYFQWALKLSKQGTLIVTDNVIREGKVLDAGDTDESATGARRFNEALSACSSVTATIIQTVGDKAHDGMAIAVVN